MGVDGVICKQVSVADSQRIACRTYHVWRNASTPLSPPSSRSNVQEIPECLAYEVLDPSLSRIVAHAGVQAILDRQFNASIQGVRSGEIHFGENVAVAIGVALSERGVRG